MSNSFFVTTRSRGRSPSWLREDGPMTGYRARTRAALTPDRIIDVAVALTARHGLGGWSIRDVNGELGASMSSLYHHVGSRPELAARVVERVLLGLEVPSADLEWREWFGELLISARDLLEPYPGVAHWMLMHGPSFPHMMPLLDTAIAQLQRAGFGENTGIVYAMLFNTAIGAIAASDDRNQQDDANGPRDHQRMLDRLRALSDDSPGGHVIVDTITPFADDDTARRTADAYYRRLLQVLFDGLEPLRGRTS